jgi:hypothetical protein
MAQPPKEMTAAGGSKSWVGSKANHVKIGDSFLQYISESDDADLSERWGLSWDKVPEKEAAGREIFGHLATYLAEVYIIPPGNKNAGQHYDQSTADGVWGGLVQTVRHRFEKSEDADTKARSWTVPPVTRPRLAPCPPAYPVSHTLSILLADCYAFERAGLLAMPEC